MSSNNHRHTRNAQRGSAQIEFLMCVAFIWVPLFLGATQFGLALIQAIRVSETCRDAGRMYAYGINFAQTANKYLLASIAPSVNLDPTGAAGSGIAIFSTVQYVTDTQCQAGGYSTTCPNSGQLVFIRQVIVGNSALHASAFGTPITNSNGDVVPGSPSVAGYLNSASALVSGFPNITLSSGTAGQQYAYICEVYAPYTGLMWWLPGSNWISDTSFF